MAKLNFHQLWDAAICGATVISPLCTAAGLVKFEPEGVPLIDCLGVTLKMAEVMVDFKDSIGMPPVGRKHMYQMPDREDIARLRSVFQLDTR